MSIGTPGLVLSKDDVRAHETLTSSSLYAIPCTVCHFLVILQETRRMYSILRVLGLSVHLFRCLSITVREQQFDIDRFSVAICRETLLPFSNIVNVLVTPLLT